LVEVGQNLTLHTKTHEHFAVPAEAGVHEFEGHVLAVSLIGPAPQINVAHSSHADERADLVRADAFAAGHKTLGDPSGRIQNRLLNEAESVVGGCEQRLDFQAERTVAAASAV